MIPKRSHVCFRRKHSSNLNPNRKAIRLQHLTPIPRGENLSEVSQALLSSLEQAFGARRNAKGKSVNELWAEERTRLLPLRGTVGSIAE